MTATTTGTALAGRLGSRVDLPLPLEDDACGRVARAIIRLALADWQVPDELIDAVLTVFSEYLSNVKQHTDSRQALLIVCLFPDLIHIELQDFGAPRVPDTVPVLLEAAEDDESFRGLELVKALASSCSWNETACGLIRRADFALKSDALGLVA